MVDKIIDIGNRTIGENQKTFIIAEVGINHNGELEKAKRLIHSAKEVGADAVKFQTYITEKRVPIDSPVYAILKKCELSENKTKELIEFAKKEGITFFSTPFDEESVKLLNENNVPLMKIASFDIVNGKLLEVVAKTGIPTIISRGMATIEEINTALNYFKANNTEYALLHCMSTYPVNHIDANLNIIKELKKLYKCPVGYSDHTIGIEVASLSVAVGANIIEKHFTLDINDEGPDHKLSADPNTLKELVEHVRKIETILGSNEIKTYLVEKDTLQYRRKS